jgi:hypothetical protein
MDQPQADYFVAIAREMPQGANIILCSAELLVQSRRRRRFLPNLTYAARSLKTPG